MANYYGLSGKLVTHDGQRDAMAQILVAAARLVGTAPGCHLYLVHTSEQEPNAVWVTEVWDTKESHDASLSIDGVRDLILEGKPLIKSMEGTVTTVIGGHGLPLKTRD